MKAAAIMLMLASSPAAAQQDYAKERERMVREHIASRGVKDARVLKVMRETPRHLFVPKSLESRAYHDTPLPIGYNQTISQPYIVASMTEMLDCKPEHKVLEIGTGSGYQAAVLAPLVKQVYTIEIVEPLAKQSAALLKLLGHANVEVRYGDGYAGWPEQAPFDRIILTAAPPQIPQALIDQLKPGGRLVAPEGREWQELIVVDKDAQGRVKRRRAYGVMFVPMVKGKDD
jgi:protein-L-isoaspartate(D-aspartate) O-methyltransferase